MARKKQPAKASQRRRRAATRGQGSSDSVAIDFEYRCRRCKLIHGWPSGREAFTLPSVTDLGKRRLWTRCPDDGPDREFSLFDPKKPTNCRKRCIYNDGSRMIRLCTPWVTHSARETREARSGTIGPALSRQQLACEWVLDCQKKSKKTVSQMDLGPFWPLRSGSESRGEGSIQCTESGRWVIPTKITHEFTSWEHRLLKEAASVSLGDQLDWFDLLDKLNLADGSTNDPFGAQQKATIYVPMDLRDSIDGQWEATYHWLRQVQTQLFRSVGKQRVRPVDRDVLTRDAYCHFLNTVKDMSASEIAKVVFPKKRRAEAIGQVRVILSQSRARLQSTGISDERKR